MDNNDKYKHIVNGGARVYYSAIAVFASILGAGLLLTTLIILDIINK